MLRYSLVLFTIFVKIPRYKNAKSATIFAKILLVAGFIGMGTGLAVIFTSPLL